MSKTTNITEKYQPKYKQTEEFRTTDLQNRAVIDYPLLKHSFGCQQISQM